MRPLRKKRVMPSKWDLVLFWSKQTPGVGFLDWGEPRCFACNQQYRGLESTDYYRLPKSKQEAEATRCCASAWAQAPLQRCHLVARQFGGSDAPGNLVLLCHECHDLAPDLPSPEPMLAWMRMQNIGVRRIAQLREAWEGLGASWDGTEALLFWWNDHLKGSPFDQWLDLNPIMGVHGTQTGRFEWVVKLSTRIAAWFQFRTTGGQALAPFTKMMA